MAERTWSQTVRARAEEALRDSEQRFRELANHGPMMAWINQPDGSCSFVSERWTTFTGQCGPDALGHGWLDAVHPDDRDAAARVFDDARERQQAAQIEYRLRHHSGVYRWVLDTAVPRFGRGGSFRGHLGSVVDITERRERESLLREAEERFRLVADQTPVVMWVHDADAELEFVNRAYCEFFGVTPEQVYGGGWLPLVHSDDGAYVQSFFAALEQRCEFRAEARVRRADGSWRWIASYGLPRYGPRGEFLGMIGVSPDVTDARIASDVQQATARQKDEFIAVLAHELRNPLAPLRNAALVLARPGLAEDRLAWCREVIERQVTQMARLLDDLLDVSRLTSGKLALQPRRVSLREVVEYAVETARPEIDARGHALAVHVDDDVWLEADPTRLTQVLANLLNNAAKYTEPGGRIAIETSCTSDGVRIEIRDNGIGIDSEMQARIFDLFTQASEGPHEARGGLGIGLHLAQRLTLMHGGTIEVQSDGRGHGSVFHVRLPRASPPQPAAVSSSLAPGGEPATRVLVVDDNVDSADALAAVLDMLGCRTAVAYDGSVALEVAAAFRPAVAFIDLGMPGIDGLEVCRRLREQPWGMAARLVALTGWGRDTDRRMAQASGFDHHLTKPADLDVIAGILRQAGEGAGPASR